MALDPSIILQAGRFDRPDVGQTLALREQIMARREASAVAARERQMAEAKMQRLGAIGAKAAGGDIAGATTDALGAGDFDVVSHLRTMDADTRKLAAAKAQAGAAVLFGAGKRPPAERAQFIDAAAPSLASQGYTAEDIAKLKGDLSDVGIAGNVNAAMTLAQQIEQAEKAMDRDLRRDEADANRTFQRGNAYISAGLIPPEGGAGGGAPAMGAGELLPRMTEITAVSESGNRERDGRGRLITSPAGAQGRMQVMPGTNVDPGFGVSAARDGSDEERTRVGRDYLAAMVDRYKDPAQAWAAYNAGPGRVDAAIKRGGNNWLSMLPAETREYVRKNVAALGGDAPAQAGLRVIPGGRMDREAKADARADAREARAEAREERLVRAEEGKRTELPKVPAATMKAYVDNNASMRKIDRALQAVDAYPDGLGGRNAVIPDFVSSRTDPKGVDVRSKVADIGSLLIHDRSGAAVTISETPRLKPFVPEVSDTPAAARTKLKNLRLALADMQADFEDAYSNADGESALKKIGQRRSGTIPAPAGVRKPAVTPPRVGTVIDGYRFNGGDAGKPSNWVKVK